MLRIGYYKLFREKDKADDWIWIIDHTIQFGKEKCLIIFGIRQKDLPPAELYLRHGDLEPIALFPVTRSNGEIVYEQLIETIEKTGVPKEIISDHGSDIKSGVEKFCHDYEQTSFIYDIKHKGAAILKRELKDDEDWCQFIKDASKTRLKVQQTSMAHLAPPNQRSKARYMNVDKLSEWGHNTLCFLDQQKDLHNDKATIKQINDKMDWLNGYRQHIEYWQELINVVKITESYVKFNGIYENCHKDLESEFPDLRFERIKDVRDELLLFVSNESKKVSGNEILLGSSEIIESVIGKFKNMEHDQAKSGFTSTLLNFASIVGKTTKETVLKAMESVPTKIISEWAIGNLGKTIQSKKKEMLKTIKNGTKPGLKNQCQNV
ncbi:MAG: hypothetical protein GY710_25730 [Desulfobacteraceae bacterium]|nr:hypothetical protein [Desulfobacteraceae bacterium]